MKEGPFQTQMPGSNEQADAPVLGSGAYSVAGATNLISEALEEVARSLPVASPLEAAAPATIKS